MPNLDNDAMRKIFDDYVGNAQGVPQAFKEMLGREMVLIAQQFSEKGRYKFGERQFDVVRPDGDDLSLYLQNRVAQCKNVPPMPAAGSGMEVQPVQLDPNSGYFSVGKYVAGQESYAPGQEFTVFVQQSNMRDRPQVTVLDQNGKVIWGGQCKESFNGNMVVPHDPYSSNVKRGLPDIELPKEYDFLGSMIGKMNRLLKNMPPLPIDGTYTHLHSNARNEHGIESGGYKIDHTNHVTFNLAGTAEKGVYQLEVYDRFSALMGKAVIKVNGEGAAFLKHENDWVALPTQYSAVFGAAANAVDADAQKGNNPHMPPPPPPSAGRVR